MTLSRTLNGQHATPASGRLFLSLLERIRVGHLVLITPDGQQRVFGDPHAAPGARLELRDWRACGAILRKGDIGFADAWRAFWVDTPDLAALLRVAIRNERALQRTVYGGWLAQMWYGLRHRLRPNTQSGSRRNIHAHYDIGNAFYARWLDPTFTYSSAVFDGHFHVSLEDAQHAKYQRIIDTLGLRAGMRVLEIGCGWGGFALHAARLGIHVHGVTISPAQLDHAQARVQETGLNDFIQLELRDYRTLTGQYDGVVSIEMFEAVGEKFWPAYFRIVRERLLPGARALVQTITIDDSHFAAYRATSDFIREFIFPGGMLPSPRRFIAAARRGKLDAQVSLAFGRDYAETLRRWRSGFETQLETIREQGFDEIFVRTWRLYLAYCEAGFDEGRTDVMQFTLTSLD
jgi:cyclopropane-fatty-acyl-phospholipid synthase